MGDAGAKKPAARKPGAKVLKKDKYDALMVVMDCGEGMARQDLSNQSAFGLAKEAADWILSRKIFTRSKDRANIVLFGCDGENNALSVSNVVVREEELSSVNFDHIRFILNEVSMSTRESNVVDALVVAVDALQSQIEDKPEVEGKTILLLTNGAGLCLEEEKMTAVIKAINAIGISLVIMGLDEKDASPQNSVRMLMNVVEKVDGTAYTFSDACSALQHFTQSEVASRAIRKNWEIAPGVRLPLALYTKSVAAKNPLKTVLVDESGEQMKRQQQLLVKDREENSLLEPVSAPVPGSSSRFDNEFEQSAQAAAAVGTVKGPHVGDWRSDSVMSSGYKVVEKTETVNGYAFGRSKIPIPSEDEALFKNHNFNEGEERGCMKLIQFTKRENILQSYSIGRNSFTVVPGWEKKTSERDLHLMRTTLSLIDGMLEENVVAICRYASDASKHLQLMALFPRKTDSGQLYMTALRLPFIDDWRPFSLPDLRQKGPAPNGAQLDLVDELIDSMDLDKTDISFTNILNPYFQRQCSMMKLMALNNLHTGLDSKVADLVPPSNFLKRGLQPDPEVAERAKKVLDVFLDDKDVKGFRLEPVVKMKRVKKEVVPVSKDHLKGREEEEDEPKDAVSQPAMRGAAGATSKMERLAGQAVEVGGAKLDTFLNGLAMQMVLWDGTNQTTMTGFLSTRNQCVRADRWREFNSWLMSLQGEPDYADFFQSMDAENHPSLITLDECAFSPYNSVDGQMYWAGIVTEKEDKFKEEARDDDLSD